MGARRGTLGTCVLAALAAGAVLGSDAAQAGHFRRNGCFAYGSAGQRGRQMGERNAKRLFDAAWSRLNRSCAQLERLATIIADTPLAAPRIGSEFTACFAQGYTEKLFAELDGAYIRCGDRCYNAGAEIGAISAQGYCAASVALGGLDDPGFIAQPALPFCGTNLVFGCKAEYVNTAVYQVLGCRQFTEGYFAETFDNTVRQDCFVPADVPIRDRFTF